jgi:cyclopropane fatty-acyl-phospholipid synthase-like methyltransferase
MSTVANLYDTLKKANDGNRSLYSIHKKLDYSDDSISNLYDYIIDQYDLTQKTNVLDCGCGVGFGTILLAKKIGANITGISVSPSEIESAKSNLASEKSLSNISFECKSFDDLSKEKYDVIIAIESLKHSPHLSKSLDSIVKALKPSGDLYIIEDVLVKSSNSLAKRKLKRDWILSKLYLEKEYTESSKEIDWITVDMTSMMRKPSRLEVIAKIIGTELKTSIDKLVNSSDSAASIFRGGFYQEWLYLNGALRYKLLKGRKR